MKKYRIKQIAEDIFIPQVKNSFFGHWYGIDKNIDHLWFREDFQNEYCICKIILEAELVIKDHKISCKKIDKTKFPIYHKIK
jgi:hypothetical protein